MIDESLKEIVRDDKTGDHISKTNYGEETEFGWEIDHIKPVSKGGTDRIGNLQPLHWKNNKRKSEEESQTKLVDA